MEDCVGEVDGLSMPLHLSGTAVGGVGGRARQEPRDAPIVPRLSNR